MGIANFGVFGAKKEEKKQADVSSGSQAKAQTGFMQKDTKAAKEQKSTYPKFVLGDQKIIAIPKDAKDAVYSLIRPYAYANIKNDRGELVYAVVEPVLTDAEKDKLNKLKKGLIQFLDVSMEQKTEAELIDALEKKLQWLINAMAMVIDENTYNKIMYYIYRDFLGLNELEPLLRDAYIEDIACDGVGIPLYVVHQRFGTEKTKYVFNEEEQLKEFVVKLAQRCDRYISYSEPLLDGSLRDGTRVQATLVKDVTIRGPTFSIRKFPERPFSPVDMVGLGTANVDMLSYLWFAIENGANILLVGSTASGKTSFLNSVCMFTPAEAKIVSIEDTHELNLHHQNWLPAVSRPGFGGSKTGEVTMFSLLKEAFRQNPQYIIVGEVRGEEANVMFQAMASGMTAMSTMHAGSADDALRRLQTRPIMLPPTLMETLDVVMVMCHAREKGANARRVKEMVEIEGVEKTGHVNVNRVFEWEPRTDVFKSADSKLLQRIADEKGFSMDYVMNDIADRKAFIQWLIQKAFDWRTITEYINLYHKDKISAIGIMKGSVNPEQVFAAKQETQPTPEQMEAFVAGVSPIVKQASAEPEKQVAAESREEEI